MSYQLAFWKYELPTNEINQKIYESLMKEELPEAVVDLPIQDILKKVEEVFSVGWEKITDSIYDNGDAMFEIMTTEKFFLAECRGMDSQDMNRIIDVMSGFECPLFDPQNGKRYDG